jgi:hypothetical protein
MLSIKFQALFTITLLHDYYAGKAFSDVLITPDATAQTLLQNQKIICRINDNQLTAYVQTKENQPIISIEPNTNFRFYLSVQNSSFYNFTSLTLGQQLPYYFSNKAENNKNNKLYLSAPVAAYKNTETYIPGTVVRQGNRVFECIQASSKTDKHATSDAAYWRDIVAHTLLTTPAYNEAQVYVTGNQVKFENKLFESIKPSSVADKHTPNENDYWQEVTDETYVTVSDIWTTPDENLPPNIFAVIDIGFAVGEKTEYAFIDSNNALSPKNYFIRFKNRSTFWKYISQKNTITAISDADNIYSFSNAIKKEEFVSVVPVPLSFAPLSSIKMNATVNARNVEVNGVPNPGVAFIKPAGTSDYLQLFSEVYLNY